MLWICLRELQNSTVELRIVEGQLNPTRKAQILNFTFCIIS
jgi:hypothetical protein